jgi:alpha-1,2-mannosyltransferase
MTIPIRLAVLLAALFLAVCVVVWPPSALQYDLRVYVVATRAFLDGGDSYTAHYAFPDDMALGFTYPPFAALVFVPVAVLGTETGRVVMTLVSALSALAIGLLSVRAVRPSWDPRRLVPVGVLCGAAGLALEPVRVTFHLGQINLVLTALLLADLLGFVPRRFRGVLVGVATGIKLTPGIFILFLLVTRRFREAAVACAAFGATVLAGWLAMPEASRRFWGTLIFDPSRPGSTHFISNQSVRGVLARLSDGTIAGGPIWFLLAGSIGWFGLSVARRAYLNGGRLEPIVLTAATGLLVSPISWTGHWTWALPVCVLLWSRRNAFWVAGTWTVATALGLPWFAPHLGDREYTHHGFDLMLGNAYILAALALLAFFAVCRPDRDSVPRKPVGVLAGRD